MRQTVRSAGLISLFLLNLTNLSAEPLLRGFFIEKLPEKVAGKALTSDKGLVLAHVFNSGSETLKPGSYQVGVEIESAGKKRSFALKPNDQINVGALKTFRMAVPVTTADKKAGYFRVFSRIDGKTIWSDKYSFLQGAYSTGTNKVTTLYTEAPPIADPEKILPPREVPFENEKTARKAEILEKSVAPVAKPAKNSAPSRQMVKNDVEQKAPPAAPAPTRQIDSSEFKKLRTIDEELVIYVIKDGDTLRSIAEKYYGEAARERTIADLNFIEKTSSVKIGEEIIVDVKPLSKAESVSKSARAGKIADTFNEVKKTNSEGRKTYKIQRGDTLGKIARDQLGKSSLSNLIIKANPGLDSKNLKVGDEIVIPENKGDNA